MKDGYERELDVGRTGCLRCSSALARLPFGRACGCSGGKHVEDLLTNPQLVRVIFHSKKALSMESICICVNPPLPTWNHRLHDRVKQLVLQSNSLESISIPSVPDEIHQNPRLRPTGQDSQQPPPSQSSKPKLHPPRTEGQSKAEGRRTSHPWPLDGTKKHSDLELLVYATISYLGPRTIGCLTIALPRGIQGCPFTNFPSRAVVNLFYVRRRLSKRTGCTRGLASDSLLIW